MPLKPIQPSELLRQISPRNFGKSGNFPNSKFGFLRDDSPGGSPVKRTVRDRSVSQKRKMDTDLSYAEAVSGDCSPGEDPDVVVIEAVSINIAKVNSLCDKICGDISSQVCDPTLISILGDMCGAIKMVNNSMEQIKGIKARKSPQVSAPFKKIRQLDNSSQQVQVQAVRKVQENLSESEDPATVRFKEAVKDAERSTLIFNLNMGKVPIMNKDTMSKNATKSLLAMAARKEERSGPTPGEEAICAIDDVLSMAQSMEFFGNTTKTYRGKNDSESGAYCTIPVKYEFQDKDTRIRAEQALRERCKIQCTTPYPPILRECIKQTLDHFKGQYPDDFIRVYVDANNMALRVARRGKDVTEWVYYKKDIVLPKEVLNVTARKAPDNLVLLNLPDHSVDAGTPTKPEAHGRQPKKSMRQLDSQDGAEPFSGSK